MFLPRLLLGQELTNYKDKKDNLNIDEDSFCDFIKLDELHYITFVLNDFLDELDGEPLDLQFELIKEELLLCKCVDTIENPDDWIKTNPPIKEFQLNLKETLNYGETHLLLDLTFYPKSKIIRAEKFHQ